MTADVQSELERRSPPDNISFDLHKEITEVTSIPQDNGTNEVEVLHAHIDEHEHIHEPVHVPESAPATNVWSVFGQS